MLSDLRAYLKQSGWKLEEPVGEYEVLRARNPNYPRPLLVHNRAERGVGYTIDGRDAKIYSGWKRNRRKRCLDPDWPTQAVNLWTAAKRQNISFARIARNG